MIKRLISQKTGDLLKTFPVVAVTGPRQSGKTTLVRRLFPKIPYFSLEDPDTREFAAADPRKFLSAEKFPIIIDEVQRVPALLSYIQTIVDAKGEPGIFILTGSNNLMLLESVSQSLAGRAAILPLLPFSFEELSAFKKVRTFSLETLLFTGSYPRIYDKSIPPADWYSSYVATYIERDVRRIVNVGDLDKFQKFVKMCAARSGQLLNLSSLGSDCGISHNTARSWLSILQASYILYQLNPHHANFNKRLVKSPKLYFYDTGLLCHLLGIAKPADIVISQYRGQIFETWVMSEILKSRFNLGLRENIYYWRNHIGQEIDCIVEKGSSLVPIEIKAGQTINSDYFKGLELWSKMAGAGPGYLVYAGDVSQKRSIAMVVGWKEFALKTVKQAAV